MPFKMHKYIIFQKKKKYVCLLYLKFSDLLHETHLFFLFGPMAKISLFQRYSFDLPHDLSDSPTLCDALYTWQGQIVVDRPRIPHLKL